MFAHPIVTARKWRNAELQTKTLPDEAIILSYRSGIAELPRCSLSFGER